MKKSIINLILSFTFVFLLANALPLTAAAGTNGGEVQTEGVISFYEDSSTIESSSTSEPRQTSAEPIKPKGNYPTTGEMVKTSLIYTGAALVIIALLLFFWKRKKNQEGRDDK